MSCPLPLGMFRVRSACSFGLVTLLDWMIVSAEEQIGHILSVIRSKEHRELSRLLVCGARLQFTYDSNLHWFPR